MAEFLLRVVHHEAFCKSEALLLSFIGILQFLLPTHLNLNLPTLNLNPPAAPACTCRRRARRRTGRGGRGSRAGSGRPGSGPAAPGERTRGTPSRGAASRPGSARSPDPRRPPPPACPAPWNIKVGCHVMKSKPQTHSECSLKIHVGVSQFDSDDPERSAIMHLNKEFGRKWSSPDFLSCVPSLSRSTDLSKRVPVWCSRSFQNRKHSGIMTA